MAPPLNSAHLLWWLRQRVAEEPNPATRAELALTVDRCALELPTENDAVRAAAIDRLLEVAALYEDRAGYRAEEWRRNNP